MNQSDNEFDKAGWIAQARHLLDDSAESLDAATLSRLNRARQGALALRTRRKPRLWLLPAGLAGACAMALAVAVMWAPHRGAPVSGDATHALISDGSAGDGADALGDDAPEFYQDLDFYAWLDAQGKDGAG